MILITLSVLVTYYQHALCVEPSEIVNTTTSDIENVRNDIIRSLEEDIASLEENNVVLKEKREKMAKECDEEYDHFVQIYNNLLARLGQNQSTMDGIEDEVARVFLKRDELTHVLEKFKGHTELLALKIKVMQSDIETVKSRKEDYPLCTKYGTIINFRPLAVDRGSFSLSRPKKDLATVLYERKKIAMDIRRDQEAYDNEELSKYLQYFTGFCQRRLEHMKLLIEQGKKHPTLDHGRELNEMLQEIKKEVVDIEQEVRTEYHKVQVLAEEATELQTEYDSLKNEINCFFAQSQWHVAGVTQEIEKLMSSANT